MNDNGIEAVAEAQSRQEYRRAAAKHRWSTAGLDQRAPGHLITVIGERRGGKLATFVLVADDEERADSPLHWERATETFRAAGPGESSFVLALSEPLPATVPLIPNFAIPADVLAVTLDALAADDRHAVNLDALKRIRSQLGARIRQVCALPESQRQHALPALYRELCKRCTSL